MPNREQRRSGELSDFEKMGFRVTTRTSRGTEPYEIQLANFSAQDEFDFNQATGLTFFEAFAKMSTYVLAGFIWLERRKGGEKKLTYGEVMKEIKFRDLETIEFMAEDDDDEEPPEPVSGSNPEPSGGPSGVTSLGSHASTG